MTMTSILKKYINRYATLYDYVNQHRLHRSHAIGTI